MRRLLLLLLLACSATTPGGSGLAAGAPASSAPSLSFPLACSLGRDCWIQQYVDRDPSAGAKDYTCGTLTYDRHSGTDIRLRDMAAERAGVNVLAAADGKVVRLRDGVDDVSVRVGGVETVKGTECGNGVVIDHGGGWETQYCHMAKGSLVVKAGDAVHAGQPLGHVGLSGETEFPHLHLSVRHGGKTIDPFAPVDGQGATCGGGQSLWRSTPSYVARAVINAGFSAQAANMAVIEAGDVAPARIDGPYLVAYVRAIGLKAGDETSLSLSDAEGHVLAASQPSILPNNRAQTFMLVGKRRPANGWKSGRYHARYVVRAAGAVVLQHDFAMAL